MRRFLIFFCMMIIFLPAGTTLSIASEVAIDKPVGINLAEAIHTAVANNPQLAAEKSRVAAAEHRLSAARSGFFPQLNVSETYQRTTNPMYAFGMKLNQETITQQDFNPDLLNDPSAMDNYATQVWVNWPLYDSGRTWYGWRQADMARQSEEAAFDRTRQEVIAKSINAYTDLVLAQDSVSVVNQAITTAQAHLKMIEKKYENGLAVKSDVLRTQVHIAELEQDKVTCDSRVAVAAASLNVVMGEDIDRPVTPETKLYQGKIESKKLNEWIDSAIANRRDLLQLDFQEKMAADEIKKSKSAYLPSVNLNGGYEWDTDNFKDVANNYSIGANVTLNLFSGGRSLSKVREAACRQQEIKAQVRALKQQIRLETEQAYRDVLSAQKRISTAKSAIELADEALRIVRNRYESGLIPLVSLLDAEVALYRSNNNYYQALKDHIQARVRLALAVGTLDEKFQ